MRAPEPAEPAVQLGAAATAVAAGLQELAQAQHLALGDEGQIVIAHPFSAGPLGFSVMGDRTLWWGGCAWDSFALPHLLADQGEVLVATRCPACGKPLVPAPRMWDDVVHTCRNQRLFCSEDCVAAWLAATGSARSGACDTPL